MTGAGLVAVVVLIAAVVALPHSSTTKTRETRSFDVAGGGPGESANAPTPTSAAGGLHTTAPGGGAAIPSANASHPGTVPFAPTRPSKFVQARAPGITSSTIYIGLSYSSQAAAGDRALGAAGAAPSYDARNVFNVVIDYANAHGGFAGRKLKAVYYDRSITNDQSTEDQSQCARFTQDNKTFVMAAGTDILDACAEKAGTIPLGMVTLNNGTSKTYAKYQHLVDPWDVAFDRLGAVTSVGLYRAKYFTGKLGIVTWDDPTYRFTLTNGYEPTLRKLHVPIVQTAVVTPPATLQAVGDMTAAVGSAVAKFKSLRIDHVIIQDGPAGVFGGAGLTLEWMNQAKSQNYYPRYGENFFNAPGWSVLPSDQQDHLLAVDTNDLDKMNDAGWHTNQTRERCYELEAAAGYPVSSANLNDELGAATACDVVFYVQRLVNNMRLITRDNFVDATQHLGTSLLSAAVFGTKLFPGRRDGGGMVRTEEYFNSCKCLKYLSVPAYAD
jgi:hypothetical protein